MSHWDIAAASMSVVWSIDEYPVRLRLPYQRIESRLGKSWMAPVTPRGAFAMEDTAAVIGIGPNGP